jgi:hypothetical protein
MYFAILEMWKLNYFVLLCQTHQKKQMERVEKDVGEGEEVPLLHTMRMESEVTSSDIYLKHPGDDEEDQVSFLELVQDQKGFGTGTLNNSVL